MKNIDRRKFSKILLLALIVILPVVIPLLFTGRPYILHFLVLLNINIVLALSMWLIMSTGQMTMAHASFAAIGAYASALLVMRAGLSFWLALPIAGVIAGVVALLVGYPSLRVKGIYFALLTFCFAEIITLLIINWSFLGGESGIPGIPRPDSVSLPGITVSFFSKLPFYYLTLTVVLVTALIINRLHTSKLGRNFRAIAENEPLAESLGIDAMRHKILAFTIGCFFAGLIGSIYAHYFVYISPSMFSLWQSIYVLLYVVIGGIASPVGAVLGAIALTGLSELLRGAKEYQPIVFGAMLLVVVFVMPNGLLGLLKVFWSWVVKLTHKKGTSDVIS